MLTSLKFQYNNNDARFHFTDKNLPSFFNNDDVKMIMFFSKYFTLLPENNYHYCGYAKVKDIHDHFSVAFNESGVGFDLQANKLLKKNDDSTFSFCEWPHYIHKYICDKKIIFKNTIHHDWPHRAGIDFSNLNVTDDASMVMDSDKEGEVRISLNQSIKKSYIEFDSTCIELLKKPIKVQVGLGFSEDLILNDISSSRNYIRNVPDEKGNRPNSEKNRAGRHTPISIDFNNENELNIWLNKLNEKYHATSNKLDPSELAEQFVVNN